MKHMPDAVRFANAFSGQDGGWIYAVQEDGTPLVKIGYTGNHPEARLPALKYEWKGSLTIIGSVYVPACVTKVERRIHVLLAAEHIEREWFYLHMNQPVLMALAQKAFTFVMEEQRQAQLYLQSIYQQTSGRLKKIKRNGPPV
jgi:hypothetical protein